jgi:hypothetical protein
VEESSVWILLLMLSHFAFFLGICLWELLSLHIYRPPADQQWRKSGKERR